jgi:hypothetical protein
MDPTDNRVIGFGPGPFRRLRTTLHDTEDDVITIRDDKRKKYDVKDRIDNDYRRSWKRYNQRMKFISDDITSKNTIQYIKKLHKKNVKTLPALIPLDWLQSELPLPLSGQVIQISDEADDLPMETQNEILDRYFDSNNNFEPPMKCSRLSLDKDNDDYISKSSDVVIRRIFYFLNNEDLFSLRQVLFLDYFKIKPIHTSLDAFIKTMGKIGEYNTY